MPAKKNTTLIDDRTDLPETSQMNAKPSTSPESDPDDTIHEQGFAKADQQIVFDPDDQVHQSLRGNWPANEEADPDDSVHEG